MVCRLDQNILEPIFLSQSSPVHGIVRDGTKMNTASLKVRSTSALVMEKMCTYLQTTVTHQSLMRVLHIFLKTSQLARHVATKMYILAGHQVNSKQHPWPLPKMRKRLPNMPCVFPHTSPQERKTSFPLETTELFKGKWIKIKNEIYLLNLMKL